MSNHLWLIASAELNDPVPLVWLVVVTSSNADHKVTQIEKSFPKARLPL